MLSDALTLARRAVIALERIADALETRSVVTSEVRQSHGLPPLTYQGTDGRGNYYFTSTEESTNGGTRVG